MRKEQGRTVITIFFIVLAIIFIAVVASNTNSDYNNISDVKQTYFIGDTVELNGWSVKLEGFDTKKYGDSIDSYSYVSDQQWIAIFLTYTNKSSNTDKIPRYVRLINSNGEILDNSVIYYNVWDKTLLDTAELVAGGSKTGFVPFVNTKIDKPEDITVQISCKSNFEENITFNFKLVEE